MRLEPFASDASLFDRCFTRRVKHDDGEAMSTLRALMKMGSIRRYKKNVVAFTIPPKVESLVLIDLGDAERRAYDAIEDAKQNFMQRARDAADAGDRINFNSLLTLILRLRQCCLDFSLVPANVMVKLLSALLQDRR